MADETSLDSLKSEYDSLVAECADCDGEILWDALKDRLVCVSEWTPCGAEHLVRIVQEYGSSVLRNAAALAIAARIEDGESGL